MVYPGTDTTLLFHQQLSNDNITVPYTYVITGGNIANLKLSELQSFLAFHSRYSCYVAERFDLSSKSVHTDGERRCSVTTINSWCY